MLARHKSLFLNINIGFLGAMKSCLFFAMNRCNHLQSLDIYGMDLEYNWNVNEWVRLYKTVCYSVF